MNQLTSENISFSYAGNHLSRENVLEHSHRGTELMYIVSGNCQLITDTENISGTGGLLLVIPPGLPHFRKNLIPTHTLYAVFDLTPGVFNQTFRSINIHGDKMCISWLQDLGRLSQEGDQRSAAGLICALLHRLEKIEYTEHSMQHLPRGISEVLRYIEKHFHEPVSVNDLTKVACLSQSYLNAQFRKATGMGTHEYLEHFRMQMARKMLLDPCIPIADVASKCGFEDAHYFARRFKAFHHQTPSHFRADPVMAGDIPAYNLPTFSKQEGHL